jgi:M6 family metalloprotease-like protein/uncharacterized repeat protein (TIGR02543 family)
MKKFLLLFLSFLLVGCTDITFNESESKDSINISTSLDNVTQYTITYHENGGVEIPDSLYTQSSGYDLPIATRRGYDFTGWFLDDDLSGEPVSSILKGAVGNIELYANWQAIDYTITFFSGGGSVQEPISYTVETDTFSLPIPFRQNYEFVGWYANNEYTGVTYQTIENDSIGNLNLYAKWGDLVVYTITYVLNGGTGTQESSYTSQSSKIVLPKPTKTGFKFLGWFLDSEFSSTAITEIPSGSSGNKTFYAKWEIVEYTIKYYLNGGTGAIDSVYTIESEEIVLDTVTRAGYDFAGYYLYSNFTGSTVTTIPAGSTGNKKIYAKWSSPINYSITYVLNGGEWSIQTVPTVTYNITSNITLPEPTKDSVYFQGWYNNPEFQGKNIRKIQAGTTEDLTLYAKWDVTPITDYTPEQSEITLEQVEKKYYSSIAPHKGDHKMLVIPVHFKNSTTCSSATENTGDCEAVREDIQKSFFGTSEEANWESVATYYNKSSYGQMHLYGEVSEWFTSSKTQQQYPNWPLESASYPSQMLLREAVEWYASTHTEEELQSFDTNNDRFIDSVWLIYDHAIQYDTWWAYKYYDYGVSGATINSPKGYQYGFASINFMYESANGGVDAHTFIHETGHVLGLDDYYNYDGNTSPLGALDMQDYNIGDENAYSKYLLDWVQPRVMLNSGVVTLKPFESSGDFLLIPASTFNESALDEYLLIEYITPTGVNYLDAHVHQGENGNRPLFYTQPGIRITHVDSRLSKSSGAYTSTYVNGAYYAHSNTPSRSKDSNISLIQLISARGYNYSKRNSSASYLDLFRDGAIFDSSITNISSQFNKYPGKFNSGDAIGFKFTVNSLNAEEAVLTFTRL